MKGDQNMYFSGSRGLGVLPYGIEPPLTVGRYGTYPSIDLAISEYERRRKAVEDWVTKVQREQNRYLTQDEWRPLLPVPYGTYIHDPSGAWYRAGDITTIAWEIMPPVIAAGPPGTWQPSTPMSEAEAAAWIAKVEASRQPLYGSATTLPERLDWTAGWTPEELATIPPPPTAAPMPYIPPSAYGEIPEGITQALPSWMDPGEEFLNWVGTLGGRSDLASALAVSFPTRAAAEAWFPGKSVSDYVARAVQFMKYPEPIGGRPPGAAPPPGAPAGGGNIAPPGTTPPGHRYPILPYAPNAGTAALREHGWPADVIGFWLTQAFGGDMALTEAFLLSFSGREELGVWTIGKTPADIYARADAALAARQAAPPETTAPGYVPPAGEAEGGISLPFLALVGAAAIYFLKR